MRFCIISILFFVMPIYLMAQPAGVGNFDEAKVGKYKLPDALLLANGKKVKNAEEWEQLQRPYLLRLFEENVYGKMPGKPSGMYYCLMEMDTSALDGKAIRKQVTINFSRSDSAPAMNVVMYLPKLNKKVLVFIGLNFLSNLSIDVDTAILPSRYVLKKDGVPVAVKRGEQSRRWPLKEIINAGFGVATAYYQDIEPDNPAIKSGIRYMLQKELGIKPEEWGAIGAWAWGLSRMQDYLETDALVDATKTIVTGHSRLGKAALWAGAQDSRFAIVISNNSGEGGAALARRNFGETIEIMNKAFPHWYVNKYKSYGKYPEKLPVDQHMLLSLIAPRPVYVASAVEDEWADPKGEFLALKNAEPVYQLYNKPLLNTLVWPAVNKPVGSGYMGYHIRTGAHDILLYDWEQYIKFAKKYF